jgi:hypothetical protein
MIRHLITELLLFVKKYGKFTVKLYKGNLISNFIIR